MSMAGGRSAAGSYSAAAGFPVPADFMVAEMKKEKYGKNLLENMVIS